MNWASRRTSATDHYLEVLETYPDGSELVAMGVVISPALPEVEVRLSVIVGGVIFDDGSIRKFIQPV